MLAILSGKVYRKLIKSQKIPLLFELDILNIVDQELGSCVNIYYIGLTVYSGAPNDNFRKNICSE